MTEMTPEQTMASLQHEILTAEDYDVLRDREDLLQRLKPEQRAELVRLKKAIEWKRLAERLAIPVRLRAADLGAAQRTPALDCVRVYLRDGDLAAGRCLLLTGPTGVGKSFAAVAALRALGHGGFWYFPALCTELLVGENREITRRRAKESPFMIFDDLGVEYAKDGGLIETFLDEIIWHREGNMRATIITTNLTVEQLKGRLSDRIVDRFAGDWGVVAECPGQSLRRGHEPAHG